MNVIGFLKKRPLSLLAAAIGLIAVLLVWAIRSASNGSGGDTPIISREGLNVAFSVTPVTAPNDPLRAGEIARLSLKINDAGTGKPVSGLLPAGWIDPLQEDAQLDRDACRTAAGTYLAGYLGIRPMIDLNSYYLVVLNADPTIAVIDPIIGVRGITKLLTQVILPGRGEDWARSKDEKTVFVAMPDVNSVAVVDLETFRLKETVQVGPDPTRILVQPDGQYVWVGTTGQDPGVTILDAESFKVVARIPTGAGHHELLVTPDNRYAFVSNRASGTVSVIDVRKKQKLRDIKLDGLPISVTHSELSGAVYIADGQTGEVIVLDPDGAKERGRVMLAPGLGPIRTAPGGRYIMAVNPAEDTVFILDSATNQTVHEIKIEGQPFQIAFSRSYAFIRSLSTTGVSMIRLADLGSGGQVTVNEFQAGDRPPADSPSLLPADLFATAVTEAATMVVSPGDANVYYYMEGMNAPMGSFGGYGHRPLSAIVADRTIKEVAPGEYVSTVKIPAAGRFQLIMTMDSPQMIECFPFNAEENPALVKDELPLRIAYETRSGLIAEVAQPVTVRFKLNDSARNGAAYEGNDVRAMTFRSPGQDRQEHAVKNIGNGLYEVTFTPVQDGAYYVYPAVPSKGLDYSRLPFLTVVAQMGEARSTAQ